MLELSGICKSYHRQNILDGVELTVRPGECVGIVGYNRSEERRVGKECTG